MRVQAILLGTVLSLTAPLAVAEAEVDAAIKYRQGIFSAMEWNLSRLAAMAQGRIEFDGTDFSRRAERLALLGDIVGEGFADANSARGDAVETRASWRIWDATDRYQALMQEMQSRSAVLQQAAAAGQERDELRPLVGRLAQSCKACHDKFRD